MPRDAFELVPDQILTILVTHPSSPQSMPERVPIIPSSE